MTVGDHVDSATIKGLVKADVKENQKIKTDGFRAYNIVGKSGQSPGITLREDLVAKFRESAVPILGSDKTERAMSIVQRLEEIPDISELVKTLVHE